MHADVRGLHRKRIIAFLSAFALTGCAGDLAASTTAFDAVSRFRNPAATPVTRNPMEMGLITFLWTETTRKRRR